MSWHEGLQVSHAEGRGRHVVATRDIAAGELLLSEECVAVGRGGHCSPRHRVPFTSRTRVQSVKVRWTSWRAVSAMPRHRVPYYSRDEGSKCVG